VTVTTGTKTFAGFTIVPELEDTGSPLGVICHEYGHQLGLPDLYDISVDGGRSTCGAWSLMDYPYGVNHTGTNPPHLDPWCKNFLRFIDLSSRSMNVSNPNLVMGDIETSQATGYYKIPVDLVPNEYFIVELRQPSAQVLYDKVGQAIPGAGVLVWHIDDSIALDPARAINTGVPHLAIDLVEADGTATYPPGKATNAFTNGMSFTRPLSNTFGGQTTGISLANITIGSGWAKFALAKIASANTVSISKIVNFPNPAGTGYPARPNTLTTLAFDFTKPPQNMDVAIYNLPGEKVKTIPGDRLKFNVLASSDYKWVYEYDWDGKNDDGENVAQGMYFYRLKADGMTKIGKLAIVR